MKQLKISNSQIDTFQKCKRLWHYKYRQHWQPMYESQNLKNGKLFHELLAYPIDFDFRQLITDFEAAKIVAMIQNVPDRQQYINAEKEVYFEVPIINPDIKKHLQNVLYIGYMDFIQDSQIIEIKTSSENIDCDSKYWIRLFQDTQIAGYCYGALKMNRNIDNVDYRVFKKPLIRPLLATPLENRQYKKDGTLYASQREFDETVEDYYLRCFSEIQNNLSQYQQSRELYRYDFRDWLSNTSDIVTEIRTIDRLGIYPKTRKSCYNLYGGDCPYLPICNGEEKFETSNNFVYEIQTR